MEQLSSCYFCGDALDASLDEHPVVPASLQPSAGDQQTVVLCGSCKRKLDAVMDAVVGAVDESGAVESASETGTATGTGGSEDATGERDSGQRSDIESTLGDDEEVLRPVGDDPASDDSADTDGDRSDANGGESDGETERKYTSSRRAGYTGENRSDHSDGNRPDESVETPSDGNRPDESVETPPDQRRSDDGGEAASDEHRSDEADGDDETPDVSLTRLENTKVMRLLKNREFPVEREDFVTVASSAYEVSPGDCDKVVDLAIEHELLREEGGQLYAGSRWQ